MVDATDCEARIRARFDAGDAKGAGTALLEAYGREVLGFLIARLRDREAASEVFSQFSEDLWKSLGTFRWQCSARAWAYMIARQAASRHIQSARRRGRRELSLSRRTPLGNRRKDPHRHVCDRPSRGPQPSREAPRAPSDR